MSGKLFIIAAPSGAGKTSLAHELVKAMQIRYPIELVTGYTSRPPRIDEKDGIDYHFVSLKCFQEKVTAGEFLEWTAGYGHYYGSPMSVREKLKQGTSCVAIMAVKSITQVLPYIPDAITIWIDTSDVHLLENRLKQRGHDDDFIKARIVIAQQERIWITTTSLFQHKIINDVFEKALLELQKIVVSALDAQAQEV